MIRFGKWPKYYEKYLSPKQRFSLPHKAFPCINVKQANVRSAEHVEIAKRFFKYDGINAWEFGHNRSLLHIFHCKRFFESVGINAREFSYNSSLFYTPHCKRFFEYDGINAREFSQNRSLFSSLIEKGSSNIMVSTSIVAIIVNHHDFWYLIWFWLIENDRKST